MSAPRVTAGPGTQAACEDWGGGSGAGDREGSALSRVWACMAWGVLRASRTQQAAGGGRKPGTAALGAFAGRTRPHETPQPARPQLSPPRTRPSPRPSPATAPAGTAPAQRSPRRGILRPRITPSLHSLPCPGQVHMRVGAGVGLSAAPSAPWNPPNLMNRAVHRPPRRRGKGLSPWGADTHHGRRWAESPPHSRGQRSGGPTGQLPP